MAADGQPPADGLTFTVLGVRDATPRRLEATSPETAGAFKRRTVGMPCGTDSTTTLNGDGSYTTRSTTGGDLWVDGDTFEFAYKVA